MLVFFSILINIACFVLAAFGAQLIWLYCIHPLELREAENRKLMDGSLSEDEYDEAVRRRRRSDLGLGLLVAAFGLQALGGILLLVDWIFRQIEKT
jgi:hypothetical protein